MERIILVYWDRSTGPVSIIQYPPEKSFPPKDLLVKIWAQHELNQESSIIEFIPEDGHNQFISTIQRFEGEIYFLILDYKNIKTFENRNKVSPEILATISKNLIELVNTNKITRAISEAFNTIKNYSKLEEEENLISFFQDKMKFTILNILRNGVISKFDLIQILREEYGFSTVNIDLLLISFIQNKLTLKKNLPSKMECYFLINDLSCIRIPPKKLPNTLLDEKSLKKYKKKVADFFINYDVISDIENKTILQSVILDKDVFLLFKTLRKKKCMSVDECLGILNNKEDLFVELIDKSFIFEIKGYVALLSDVHFIKFLPIYIIEKLIKRYKAEEISSDEYLAHLKLLIDQPIKQADYISYDII